MQGSGYLTKGYVGGDFLISEDALPTHTRESGTIAVDGGGTATVFPAGTPMKQAGGTGTAWDTPLRAASVGQVTALTLEKVTVLPGQTVPVGVICRGPICINFEMLPTVDYAGTAIVAATFKAALTALNGFVVRDETTGSGSFEQDT